MAIKNTLFGLSFILLILNLISCDTFRERHRGGSEPRRPQPQKTVEVTETEEVRAEAPEFLKKEPPKLGLILGGGGALAYAHIGLLQELEAQKVPIHSLAGIEWGALVAATYAHKNKAHSVEWSLLKLPVDKFDNSGFFSSSKKAIDVDSFDGFLQEVFGNQSFSGLRLPFTCPFVNVAKEVTGIRRSGRVRNAVRSCWALPPHFEVNPVGANPLGVAEVARQLRAEEPS